MQVRVLPEELRSTGFDFQGTRQNGCGNFDLIMVYITQYGAWWSTTEEGWKALIEYVLEHPNEGYNLDKMTKPLTRRPSTIRVDGNRRSGDFWYYTIKPFDHIVKPLDWDETDWENALEEVETWKRIKRP